MKRLMKIVLEWIFTLLLAPILLLVRLDLLLLKSEGSFVAFGKLLSLVPGLVGVYLRRGFYSHTLSACGRSVTVEFGAFFSRRNACLGDGVYIGAYSILGTVTVGDGVLIASRVSIPSGRHQHMPSHDAAQAGTGNLYQPVSVGAGSWIGEGAVVLNSVGNNCIVGAGSVVVREVAPNTVVAGNPAVEKRKLS